MCHGRRNSSHDRRNGLWSYPATPGQLSGSSLSYAGGGLFSTADDLACFCPRMIAGARLTF
jgi:CubicO group peptidase (beta-lactamase class C family)